MKQWVLNIAGIVCSIVIILLAALQLSGVWEHAVNVFEPLLGVLMLIQAAANWERNKIISVFSLGVAVFVFVTAAKIWFF